MEKSVIEVNLKIFFSIRNSSSSYDISTFNMLKHCKVLTTTRSETVRPTTSFTTDLLLRQFKGNKNAPEKKMNIKETMFVDEQVNAHKVCCTSD